MRSERSRLRRTALDPQAGQVHLRGVARVALRAHTANGSGARSNRAAVGGAASRATCVLSGESSLSQKSGR